MKKQFLLVLTLMVCGCLVSCSDLPNVTWQPDLFSPIGKGRITLENVISANKLSFDFTANLPVPVSPVAAPVPAFGPVNTSAKTLDFNTPIVSVLIDSLKVTGTLTNPMPVAISAGAELVFRQPGNATPVFKFTLTQAVPANGKVDFSFLTTQVSLTPQFTCTIENISSPGSSAPVSFGGQPARLQLSFTLALIKVASLTIQNNISDYYETTNNFNAGIESKDEVTGKLILNLENSFPITLGVQAYLLDANKKVLDSLFTTPLVILPGTPQSPKAGSATVTADNIVKDLKTAAYLKVRSYYSTKGSAAPVTVTKDSKLDYQLTGDLKLTIKP